LYPSTKMKRSINNDQLINFSQSNLIFL